MVQFADVLITLVESVVSYSHTRSPASSSSPAPAALFFFCAVYHKDNSHFNSLDIRVIRDPGDVSAILTIGIRVSVVGTTGFVSASLIFSFAELRPK